MEFDLYVPAEGELLGIMPKSGIVGTWKPETRQHVLDYEGNKFGSSNIVTYADRCLHAAGRHSTLYPTIARMVVDQHKIQYVGTFETTFGEVKPTVVGYAHLQRWLGLTQQQAIPPEELLTSNGPSERVRTARSWTATQRRQLRFLPANERRIYEKAGLIP